MVTMLGWLRAEAARASRMNAIHRAGAPGVLDNLDRHGAPQAGIHPLIHFAHATAAEQRVDPVGPDLRAQDVGHDVV